jgi:hypothetical protein
MDTWELVARERIRSTYGRYTHDGDSGRAAELAACFTGDGVLEVRGDFRGEGRPGIVAALTAGAGGPDPGRRPAWGFVRHFVANVFIASVTPGRAEAAYFLVVTRNGPDHWGRYRDVLVPAGDEWLFQHRRVTIDGMSDTSYARPNRTALLGLTRA